jgi:hypothetical protein
VSHGSEHPRHLAPVQLPSRHYSLMFLTLRGFIAGIVFGAVQHRARSDQHETF